MHSGILELNGLSIDILDKLSYKSQLGINLKKNLHYFDKEALLNELFAVSEWMDEQDILSEIALDYRVKSVESILGKYARYYPDHQVRKVFNDILGFRAFCDNYEDVLEMSTDCMFHVADMSKGKSDDDGYRGVHLYFQKDNSYYPIEIQFNTLYDRQLNNWLHEYLYKKNFSDNVGKIMRKAYEAVKIKNVMEFEEVLNNVLLNC